MAFLANKELNIVLPEILGTDFDEDNIKNASYELLLGNEIYTNNDSTKTILNDDNSQFELKPGQFALLITKEKISIPSKYIGFISLKFGFKKKGLVNISGFHVDPGFSGNLKFSVYNAGSKSIILQKNKPYFMLWLSELTSELSEDETYGKDDKHQSQHEINPDDIMNIHGETASPNDLLEKIKSLEATISTEREWRRWGLRIIIGILIAIGVKMLWDWNDREKGYHDALIEFKEKSKEAQEKKEFTKEILFKVDSLLKVEKVKDSL